MSVQDLALVLVFRLAPRVRFLIEALSGLGPSGSGEAAATSKFRDIGGDPAITGPPGFRVAGNIIVGDIAGSTATGDNFYKK